MFLYSNHFTDSILTFLGGDFFLIKKKSRDFFLFFCYFSPCFCNNLDHKGCKTWCHIKESFDFEEYDDWDDRNLIWCWREHFAAVSRFLPLQCVSALRPDSIQDSIKTTVMFLICSIIVYQNILFPIVEALSFQLCWFCVLQVNWIWSRILLNSH